MSSHSTGGRSKGASAEKCDGDDESRRGMSSEPFQSTEIHRHSSFLACQLKVLESSVERLMNEKEKILNVQAFLYHTLSDLDGEISTVKDMLNVARNANFFQNGYHFEPVVQMSGRSSEQQEKDDGADFVNNMFPDLMNANLGGCGGKRSNAFQGHQSSVSEQDQVDDDDDLLHDSSSSLESD